MLKDIDLGSKTTKDKYKSLMPDLEYRMGFLQREARKYQIPVIIVFEGWDAAGKGTLINKLILSLDPRGSRVHSVNPPNEEEKLKPFLWRFWTRTPENGRIAIFDRSWYGRVLVERVDRIIRKKVWTRSYDEINSFERQLKDSGAVIVKFFLHISKKEQKKRFRKLKNNPSTAWKVTREDWKHHKQYHKYEKAVDDMLERTVGWTVIGAHDRYWAGLKIFQTVIQALESRIGDKGRKKKKGRLKASALLQETKTESSLDRSDLTLSLTRDKYERLLKKYQKRIRELEHEVYKKRIPVLILYEGWDAAGKGGNIRRLVQGLDPRGYEVVPVGAPDDTEKKHHYLWRFWKNIPKAGHITIFDRTWYGRVLVERVEGFCLEEEWKRAYIEIREMEDHMALFGVVIFKFWLHIDQKEQLRRFKVRQAAAHKQWKITEEDWRNREKWDLYKKAVDDMVSQTGTSHAPWTIVEANCKLYARIKVLQTIVERLENRCL